MFPLQALRHAARRGPALGLSLLLGAAILALSSLGLAAASPAERSDGGAGAFRSAGGGSPVTLWAVGDADATPAGEAVARLVASGRPDLFLYLGDVYEDGTAEEFARNYAPLYGSLAGRTLPTPGNHDRRSHEEGYDPFWSRVTGGGAPHFYRASAGGWDILSLNSEGDDGSLASQARWLESQVSRPGTCRLAFWHGPRHSAGKHGDQESTAPLWDALRGKAALVLGAHDHDMQRMRPRDGIVELIAGSGGRKLYEVDEGDSRLAWSNDRDYGALRLRLRPGRAEWTFFAADGRALDGGSVPCRAR